MNELDTNAFNALNSYLNTQVKQDVGSGKYTRSFWVEKTLLRIETEGLKSALDSLRRNCQDSSIVNQILGIVQNLNGTKLAGCGNTGSRGINHGKDKSSSPKTSTEPVAL